MTSAACSVCQHPNRVAIDVAIAAGTPPLRELAAIQSDPKLSYGAISRHSRKCAVVRRTPETVVRSTLDRAAIQQVAKAQENSLRAMVADRMDRSTRHEDQLDALWSDAFGQLTDDQGKLRPLVDQETGQVRFDMLEQLLQLSKARVDARGGGSLKWATLAAQVDGMIGSGGSTTNIQVNIEQERARVIEAVKSLGEKDVPQLMGEALGLFLDAKGLDEASDVFAVLVEFAAHTADHVGGPNGLRDRFDKALTVGADGRVEGSGER